MILCSGCGGGSGSDEFTAVTLRFAAKIAGEDFSCGRTYEGVGTTGSVIVPKDLRFYVSGVELVDRNGQAVPLQLVEDGQFQHQGLALLDFEDGSAGCAEEGDARLHTSVTGTAPEGDYTQVRFVVGVPFAMNHRDAATAEAPQDVTPMWWNWNFGYKFLKFDFGSTGLPDGFRTHIGSTECIGNEAGAVVECGHPNRISVSLADFSPERVITAELGHLVSGVDVDFNTSQTAPGCMSGQTDPECPTVFRKLGLPFGTQGPSSQELFYLQ